MALHLLHGTFHVTVMQVSNLTDEHRHSPNFLRKLVEGIEDVIHLGKGSSKLYVSIEMGENARVGRTRIITKEPANPVWNESFHIYCAYNVADVVVCVKDDQAVGAEVIGQAKVPVTEILSGEEIDQWYDLYNEHGEKLRGHARIHLRMQYFDISTDPFYGRGVVDHKYPGVPYTYFRQYKGCKLTLYQDSHSLNTFTPKIYLSDGKMYEIHRCWEDIYKAIDGAKHLVYITGWSVYTKIELVRDRQRPVKGAEGVTLGELLKKKADEGVRVNMLVWDDRTSVPILKKDGIMATHDEDTEDYFKGSQVNCVLCPRNPDNGLSIVQEIEISTMFTHHQKIVIVDAPLPGKACLISACSRSISSCGCPSSLCVCVCECSRSHHSRFLLQLATTKCPTLYNCRPGLHHYHYCSTFLPSLFVWSHSSQRPNFVLPDDQRCQPADMSKPLATLLCLSLRQHSNFFRPSDPPCY